MLGKTQKKQQSPQLHLYLIYLHCTTNWIRNQFWWCVWFFSQFFLFIMCNIYLFTFVFKICLFILAPRYNWNIVESGIKHHKKKQKKAYLS
jgi:hypothetical protein